MSDEVGTKQIWKSLSAAIGVELREATTIRGASGQDHPVQAIAVDDNAKRVVVFSAEASPRIAALMQTDVQGTLPGAHVIVARPVIFNLSEIARRVFQVVDAQTLEKLLRQMGSKRKRTRESNNQLFGQKPVPAFKPLFETATKVKLPLVTQVTDIIEQIANNWPSTFFKEPKVGTFIPAVLSMATVDSAEADRSLGVCPIPLYEFSEADYELLLSGRDIDELRARLKALGIYQYFFPAPDQLLLGLADNKVTKDGNIILAAEEAPAHGHPLGAPELFQDRASLLETLEELKGAGYVAEAEFGIDLTDKGRAVRQSVKIRPREGLINKLSKIVSIKFDFSLKDLLK